MVKRKVKIIKYTATPTLCLRLLRMQRIGVAALRTLFEELLLVRKAGAGIFDMFEISGDCCRAIPAFSPEHLKLKAFATMSRDGHQTI